MYLIRLDDASEHWNREKWLRMHDILAEYRVKPLFAIIPHNEDDKLLKFPKDEAFWETVSQWISEGWLPGLHGYNHVLSSKKGGLHPVNLRSEFAGEPLEKQKRKIADGLKILHKKGIFPQIFVAPAHTFDENTLEALRLESNIRIISDTIASDVYLDNGFYFIPQQSGMVRRLRNKVTTFCYHPNNTTDKEFAALELFVKKYQDEFQSFDNVELKFREFSFLDKILRSMYMLRCSLRRALNKS